MRTQVYVIMHDGTNCLVFRKNAVCRFRNRTLGDTPVNGPGSWCFPGGKMEAEQTPEDAGKAEFEEETGCAVTVEGAPFVSGQGRTSRGAPIEYIGFFAEEPELDTVFEFIRNQLALANDPAQWEKSAVRDNELASVALVPIASLNTTYFRQGDADTGWFFNLVREYFK